MQKAFRAVALVVVGYLLLIGAVVVVVPRPWNFIIAAVVFFKAAGYLFAVKRASALGAKRKPPQAP